MLLVGMRYDSVAKIGDSVIIPFGPPKGPTCAGSGTLRSAETRLLELSKDPRRAWDGSLGADSDRFIRPHCVSDFRMLNQSATLHESPFPRMETLEEAIADLGRRRRINPGWRVNMTNFSLEIC